jgi:DNA-binding response OmpR family regulator
MKNLTVRDTVLVIDDDSDIRLLIETFAQHCKVPVLQASNCYEAMRILDREGNRIKLILMDYYMPGMDPVECAAAVKRQAGPEVTIILLTAASDPAHRAAGLKIARWIAKPFELSTLNTVLLEKVESSKG